MPAASAWFTSDRAPAELLAHLHAPAAVTTDGARTGVWLEGHPGDLAAQATASALTRAAPPARPAGPHRGRISVAPGLVAPLGAALDAVDGLRRLSEHGVGTIHVAADTAEPIAGGTRPRPRPPRMAAPRGRRPRPRPVRRRTDRRGAAAPDPRRARPDRQARTRPRARDRTRGRTRMSTRDPIALRLDEAELVACVGCGLCLPHCPTYRVTGEEIASPRGRIAAMRAVSEGRAPLDAAFTAAMDACIQCRGCEAACPSGVQFGHLMEDTRAALEPRRARSRRAGRGGRVPRRPPAPAGPRRRDPGPRRGAATARRAPEARAPDPAGPAPGAAHRRHRIRTCTCSPAASWTPGSATSTGPRCASCAPRAPASDCPAAGGDCCGALHTHAGRPRRRRAARAPGHRRVPRGRADRRRQRGVRRRARRLRPPARHRRGRVRSRRASSTSPRGSPTGRCPSSAVVTSRSSCRTPATSGTCSAAHLPVAALLGRAYDVRLTADDGLCCGAGGAYSAFEPELSAAVRDRKVHALRAAAAGRPFVVASANPGCALHLRRRRAPRPPPGRAPGGLSWT